MGRRLAGTLTGHVDDLIETTMFTGKADTMVSPLPNLRRGSCTTMASIALLAVGCSVTLADDEPLGLPPNPSRLDIMDRLLKLPPAERYRLLSKVLHRDKDIVAAERGELTSTIVERGRLEAALKSDVVVRARTPADKRAPTTRLRSGAGSIGQLVS